VVVVVVSFGARARDEREHEGKEKNADGGETSGRHGSVECVRREVVVANPCITTRFYRNGAGLSNQNNALKVRRHRK
jgi:hypothetical protein